MLTKIRKAMKGEEGFTLIELMVVILIIGILMAIAIPSFFAVRNRAYATSAKSTLTSAVKAMELYGTDNDGSFLGATLDDLIANEPTLGPPARATDPVTIGDAATATTYDIHVVGRDGTTYTATKAAGVVTYLP
ncbi:MAG: prepilin-type N-terminal cleavage/methylation domain-containing protein [Actinomycetota bacterium]